MPACTDPQRNHSLRSEFTPELQVDSGCWSLPLADSPPWDRLITMVKSLVSTIFRVLAERNSKANLYSLHLRFLTSAHETLSTLSSGSFCKMSSCKEQHWSILGACVGCSVCIMTRVSKKSCCVWVQRSCKARYKMWGLERERERERERQTDRQTDRDRQITEEGPVVRNVLQLSRRRLCVTTGGETNFQTVFPLLSPQTNSAV